MKYSESENAGVSLADHLTPGRGSEDVPFPFPFFSLLGTKQLRDVGGRPGSDPSIYPDGCVTLG